MSAICFILGATAVVLFLLWCGVRNPQRNDWERHDDATSLEERGRRHATYLPVIQQAMSFSDFQFLASRASNRLVRRTHRERQRIARVYLSQLRADFESLLRLAQLVAVLSPGAGASQEFERFRLSLRFSWRYRFVVLGLNSGLFPLPQISGLSQIVSEFAARMEGALRELGERAAVATELASSLDRRRLDLA